MDRYEAAVIGGGIIGTSIAWRLAQSARQVTILEAGALGGEASWAGAGMLAPGGELGGKSRWADFALESLGLYPAYIEQLEAESDLRVDYQRLGAIEVAFTSGEWRELETRAAAQRALGIASERLDATRLRSMAPLLAGEVEGSLYYPQDALVDPRHVMQALRIACERRGVTIREHSPVREVRLRRESIEIDTAEGTLTSGCAVLAAGAWSSGIAVRQDGERVPLPVSFPVKGHLLGYGLEAGSLGPIVRQGKTYVVQRASGFTVAGSSMEEAGFDRSIDCGIVEDVRQRAGRILPILREAPPAESWIGFRPATAGYEPELGQVRGSRLWLSYGHFRNGILLAPATALRISREILQA